MKKIALFLVITIFLLGAYTTACSNQPDSARASPIPLDVRQESLSEIEVRLDKLDERITDLAQLVQSNPLENPWIEPFSLEERVRSLESLVKSEPWEVRESPYFSPSIEERLSRIEEKLGIEGSRLWNP